MAAYPSDLVLTDNGIFINVTGTGLPSSTTEINLPKGSYEPRLVPLGAVGTGIHLVPLNGAVDIGYILNANLVTPYPTTNDLWEAIIGFFNFTSMTSAELLDAINNGTLPAGQWIFVSDLNGTHQGGWLFCSTNSTVAVSGFGNYLDACFLSTGDTSDIEAETGVAYTLTNGQWYPEIEQFAVNISGIVIVDDGYRIGDTVSDGSGWQGVVVATDNSSFVAVYSTIGDKPVDENDLTSSYNGTMAFIESSTDKYASGFLVCYIDTTNYQSLENGYEIYQCIDNTLLDGTSPKVNTAAYYRLPRGTENFGYVKKSRNIDYDQFNAIVTRRWDQNISVKSDTLHKFECLPWGSQYKKNIAIQDGGKYYYFNDIATVDGVEIGLSATFGANNGSYTLANTSSVAGIVLDRGAICSFNTDENATIQNTRVLAGIEYSGKTISGTVTGGVISQSDSTTENVTVGQFDNLGYRYAEISISSAEILAGGVTLLPAVADKYYSHLQFDISYTHVTTPYANGGELIIKQGSTVVVKLETTLIYLAEDRVMSCGWGLVANRAQSTTVGQSIDFDFSSADTGDGILFVVARYLLADHRTA